MNRPPNASGRGRGARRRDEAARKAGYRDWKDYVVRVKQEASCAEVASRWGGIHLHPAGQGAMILCPFHNERTPSCHLEGNKFHCFGAGCGEAGDVVKFTMKLTDSSFVDTVLALGSEFGLAVPELPMPLTGQALAPAPAAAGPAPQARQKPAAGGPQDWPVARPELEPDLAERQLVVWFRSSGRRWYRPTSWHHYRDMAARLVALAARTEQAGGRKIVLPVTWRINPETGWGCWVCAGFPPGQRPLYGREYLHPPPGQGARILIVDGEKTADAANRLLAGQGWAALSVMGGCRSGHLADWSDLSGLIGQDSPAQIVVWPDADRPQPGEPDPPAAVAARLFGALAQSCGADLLQRAECRLVRPPSGRKHGWALDDAEMEGLDAAWALAQIDQAASWRGE